MLLSKLHSRQQRDAHARTDTHTISMPVDNGHMQRIHAVEPLSRSGNSLIDVVTVVIDCIDRWQQGNKAMN